jgi:ferredoxin--NADP+ reductase
VDLIIESLKEPKISEGITALLKSGHEVIDQLAWEKINASEVISGEIAGKPACERGGLEAANKFG